MNNITVLCLGSMDMRPIENNDCSSFLINEHVLIDCGTSPAINLLNAGVDIKRIDSVVFTHMHMDHCVGFASFIFLLRTRKIDHSKLTVYGPKGEIVDFIDKTFNYLGLEKEGNYPTIIELEEDCLTLPGGDLTMYSTPAQHAVKGVCLKFKAGEKALGYSADTAYMPKLAKFFSGCDVLIHECSFGKPNLGEEDEHNAFKLRTGHSDVSDAVRVATESKSKSLYLTHSFVDHAEQETWLREICSLPGKFLHYKDVIKI